MNVDLPRNSQTVVMGAHSVKVESSYRPTASKLDHRRGEGVVGNSKPTSACLSNDNDIDFGRRIARRSRHSIKCQPASNALYLPR